MPSLIARSVVLLPPSNTVPLPVTNRKSVWPGIGEALDGSENSGILLSLIGAFVGLSQACERSNWRM